MARSILDVAKGPFRNEVIERVKREDYDAITGLNPSSLVERRKSAKHFRAEFEKSWKDTEAMRFGRCCHAMLLEPDTFNEQWIPWSGASYGKQFESFASGFPGKEFIKTEGERYTLSQAMTCVTAALSKPDVRDLVSECSTELTVLVEQEGLQCRGLIDAVSTKGGRGVMMDPKFTDDVSEDGFARSAAKFKYHLKMACYKNWFEKATGKHIDEVCLIAIETKPPYDVVIYELTDDQLEDGWSQACDLIRLVADDIRKDEWHGVDRGFSRVQLPLPYWCMQGDEQVMFEGAEVMEVIE